MKNFRFSARLHTVFFFFLFCGHYGFAQSLFCPSGKEGNWWYFGDSLVLDFNNTGAPQLSYSGFKSYEGSATASDSAGNLLFYFNGEYVWNRNHQIMPSLLGAFNQLKGSESAIHNALLRHPTNKNLYYLFYPEVFDNITGTSADTLRKMYYAIVDLSANAGLGNVVSKNNILFTKTTEKIAITHHCNGRDWWILTLESGSNRFMAWLLDDNGLQTTPIVSTMGKTSSPFGAAKVGTLKFSANGRIILKIVEPLREFSGATYDGYTEIFYFNTSTGTVSNPILLEKDVKRVYGGEFSPDNKKLYFDIWTPGDSLYQYDLCTYDSAAICHSKINLGKAASNTGQMQLGPDGKIYLTSNYRPYLSVIHQPNATGLACQYERQAINVTQGEALLGLPTFPASYYAPGKPYIAVENQCAALCADSVRRYHVVGQCLAGATYAWSAAGGTVLAQQGDTAWVKWKQPGQQYVAVHKTWACGERSDTLRVTVEDCAPPAVTVCASGKEGNIWYFGDSLGLDFNTLPPQVLTDSKMSTYEASTIVSDSAGKLLFYSNGEYVWNRNHQLMPAVNPAMGGSKLIGSESATQILALPWPEKPGFYYLFYMETFDNLSGQPEDTLRKMFFSIINMNLDNGLGNLSIKDSLLFNKTTEKIGSTLHCDGKSWWISALESGSSRFFAWWLNTNGLQNAPVISALGIKSSAFGGAKSGGIKFSPDGGYLVTATNARKDLSGSTYDAFVELSKFSNSTGLISSSITIIKDVRHVYGTEFSPDNLKLYFNAWTPGDSLYQYDLCIYDSLAIRNSKINLGKAASNTGQMQLGPDGKIYLTSAFRNYLSVIHQPNHKGLACQYEPQAIPLPREALLGLPTFPASYYAPGKPYIAVENQCTALCADSVRRYHVVGQCVAGATYAWSAAGGTVLAQQGDTAWVRWQQPGQQYVAVRKTWACGERSDTLRVTVEDCAPPAAPVCASGKEGNIWYFSDSLGLDFNTTPPAVLTDSKMNVYEGSTIMTDSSGALLFYCNGEFIWDKTHDIMPNLLGSFNNLKGSESATHNVAIRQPGNPNIYYVFYPETADNVLGTSNDTLRNMYYAIVDMSLRGGLGDVISKNNVLFTKTTEKIAVAQHCNGRDWWIVTTESGSNRYLSWLFSPNGISNTPVLSSTGKINKPFGAAKAGSLQFSPNGRYLHKAVASFKSIGQPWSMDAFLEIALFNNQTGKVSNSFTLIENMRSIYGAEFSPDNTKLYFNTWSPGDSLYQYDLCIYDSLAIRNSKINLGKAASNTGQMQLGPDGKIYLTSTFRNYLSVIHQPNLKGLACQYQPQAIPLPRQALLGLPTFPASYYAPGKPYIAVENQCTSLCADSVRRYHVVGQCLAGASYAWSAAGGTVLAQQGDTAWVKWQQPGQQYVAVHKTWACGERSDTLRVGVENCAPCAPVRVSLSANTCVPALAGIDTLVLSAVSGCDSVVITTTVLQPSRLSQQSAVSCNPALAGVDTLALQTTYGCDSLIVTTTSWQPSYTLQQSATTCNPALAGVDTLALQTTYGCDSLIVTTTAWQPSFTIQQSATTCNPALAGVDTLALQTAFGCDSLIVTTTTWHPFFTIQQSAVTCNPALAGVDTLALQTAYGCDSLIVTTTSWQPFFTVQQSATTCNPALAGVDTLALQTAYGCDSLIVTTTTWQPFFTIQQSATTCNPALAGVDTLALQTAYGCDSLIVTTTTWQPFFTIQQSATTCNPALAGVDTLALQTTFGCDSLIVTTTTWQPFFTVQQSATTCNPALAGVDTLALQTAYGCDSLIVTTTSWQPFFTIQQSATTCNPALAGVDTLALQTTYGCDSLIVTTTSWQPFFTLQQSATTCNPALAGVDTLALQTAYGCDSLIVTTTSWQPFFTIQQSATTCNPALAGIDTLALQTAYGCDSLIVTTTTWQPFFTIQQSATTCNPALAGVDTLALQTAYGCDSLIVTTTTWQPFFTIQQSATTCNPALAGVDTLALQTAYGCDSLIVTTTTWQPFFTIQQSAVTCNPALAGVDTLALQTAYGCDSLIVTTTSWQPFFTIQQSAVTCNPALVGVDTLALQTAYGCDSLIVTTTTWQPFFTIQQSATTCNPALAGVDTLALQTTFGCDSLIVTTRTWQPFFTIQQSATTCNPALAGVDTLALQTAYGCDSLIVTTRQWIQPFLDLGLDQSIRVGDTLTLSATTNLLPSAIAWQPAAVLSCPSCLTTLAFPTRDTWFTLQLSDANGCETQGQLFVAVSPAHAVYLPNVFRPASRQDNAGFTVYIGADQAGQVRRLAIYDRWGGLAFQKTDFPANEPGLGWDGDWRGVPCPAGVYVYWLEIEWPDGSTDVYSGDVTLLR